MTNTKWVRYWDEERRALIYSGDWDSGEPFFSSISLPVIARADIAMCYDYSEQAFWITKDRYSDTFSQPRKNPIQSYLEDMFGLTSKIDSHNRVILNPIVGPQELFLLKLKHGIDLS
jgi:hypothetical protein